MSSNWSPLTPRFGPHGFALVALLAFSVVLSTPTVAQQEGGKEAPTSSNADGSQSTANPDANDDTSADDTSADDSSAGAQDSGPATQIRTVRIQDEWFNNDRWHKNFDDAAGSVFDPIDTHFGNVVVTPVQSVFFYDLYYFDNEDAKTFGAVSGLRNSIKGAPKVPGAQKELKKVRRALGLPVEDDEAEQGEEAETADEEEAEEKKKLTAKELTDLRNGLKDAIHAALGTILSSKLPTEEMKSTFIAIKKPFFDLDLEVMQSKSQKLTKQQLISAVEAVSEPVKSLEKFANQSLRELAWTLNKDIKAADRVAYFRGYNVSETEAKIDEYIAKESFINSLEGLVEAKKIAEEDGVYSVYQKTDDDGKTTYAKFAAIDIPFIVLWLVLGASFFTIRMTFINLRGFTHAIRVTKGDFDDPDDPGEISHFQALSSALSATVGLGNISGVAIAVFSGGPGALIWMILAGFLGMTSKFTECTLGQMYRKVDDNGHVLGGPMRYLSAGLAEMRLGLLGKLLAVMFVVLCIGGSLGGGNMFQSNQSFAAVSNAIPWFEGKDWLYGLMLAFVVGLVILGGIKRIGTAAGLIVPVMCLIYVLAGLFVILVNATAIPSAFGTMFESAFSFKAGMGGLIGTLVVGFQRAAFSNEAGTGSASIAHSAAATDEPVREGIVALLEPFIDTIVVCTMTGLVVVITKAYEIEGLNGVEMTSQAFGSVISWFPYVLSVAVVLFAFSTMISWSYYGERCAIWLFGEQASVPYKILFLIFVFLGAVMNLNNVLGFSDLMILGMAFPNVLGLFLLSGKVRRKLDEYWGKLEKGEFEDHSKE